MIVAHLESRLQYSDIHGTFDKHSECLEERQREEYPLTFNNQLTRI